MNPSDKPLLTPSDFYEAMGGTIGRNTIYELLRARRIKNIRMGRKILIPRSEVTDFPEREVNLLN